MQQIDREQVDPRVSLTKKIKLSESLQILRDDIEAQQARSAFPYVEAEAQIIALQSRNQVDRNDIDVAELMILTILY